MWLNAVSLSVCVLQSATMSAGQSPFELIQNGERRVTLHYLGYGRVLLCAARDFDLSRPSDGISLTPFGVIFETNLMVRLQTGYTLLVTSAAGSYIQVHTNVVIGSGVSLTLYLALNGRSALQPRAYREQPLAVVSLMESSPRPDMPIQTLINLDDDDDDQGPSGAAAPPPSLLQTPAESPEPPATLVPETEDEAEDGPVSGSGTLEAAAVPSSDPEERAAEEELQGAVGGTEEEGSESSSPSGLWTGGESDSEETDSEEEADDSEGGDDGEDDEVLGGDPLQGSAGSMGVRHRAGLYMFTLRAGDDEVPFPPNRGFPLRRLVREIELQLSEDARNIAWQSSVDCSCCPFDCIFFRGHWKKEGDQVRLTLAVASHMFSNIPTMNMFDVVRLVVEHRARVIFGGPISVTGEAL